MNINIASYVKRLRDINLLDTIVEAVSNSLHAEAREIEVFVEYQEMVADLFYISSVTIRDNGEGFHLKNQESFDTFMSDYNIKKGGRGVGRFSFLKVFSHVVYSSVYRADGKLMGVRFSLDNAFSASSFKKFDGKFIGSGTELVLSIPNEKYCTKKQACKSIDDIKEYLQDKLLVEFVLNDEFAINIASNLGERVTIRREDMPVFDELTVQVYPVGTDRERLLDRQPEQFLVRYCFDRDIEKALAYYCVERRTVKELGLKICLSEGDGAVFLVTGAYVDRYANDFRTKFDFPKDLNPSPELVEEELGSAISNVVNNRFPAIPQMNNNVLQEIKNKYPYLKRYISKGEGIGIVDGKDIVAEAVRAQRKAKERNIQEFDVLREKYCEMLKKHAVDDALVDKFVSHIADTNELNKENLVEFVWYCDTIIDFVVDIVRSGRGDEATLHNILIKKGHDYYKDKKVVQAKRNNMWLFGHQFMGYDYIASDKTIRDILNTVNKSVVDHYFEERRPDIFMVMPSSDVNTVTDVVLFELKRVGVDLFDKLKGVKQLEIYTDALLENMPALNMVWGYLLIDFDPEIERALRRDRYGEICSEHGKAYSQYNDQRKLLLTVLYFEALLSMAKKRNEVFTGMLEEDFELV